MTNFLELNNCVYFPETIFFFRNSGRMVIVITFNKKGAKLISLITSGAL